MTTQSIFVMNGHWYTGYEPYDMPGAFCRARYSITSIDGSGMLADGRHKGFVPVENTLRIVQGGEYSGGCCVINQQIRDFAIQFDDEYHDDFRAGVERGYKGKRGCSYDYFCRQSHNWQDGYREGRQSRQQSTAA